MRAAQQRAHARDHFVRAERLGDVVVGAQLQPDDAVRLFGAGGEHDDRHGGRARVAAQRAADLEAVEAGQHQVEQHEIRQRPAHRRQHLGPGMQQVHGKPGAAQAVAEQVRDVVVVFDHEKTRGGGGRLTGHGRGQQYTLPL